MHLLDYWKEFVFIIGLLSAYFGGRKSKEFKEKTEGADSIGALQRIYDKYIEHNAKITEDLTARLTALEKHNRDLQKNFNDMQLSYAIVMGENQKSEVKYNLLVKEYEQLKVAHDALKLEFDKYKKGNK